MSLFMDADQSVLVIIDEQQKLLPVIAGGDHMLAQTIRLASIAGLLGIPVIATEQTPDKLGPNHPDIKRLCDLTLAKTHFDACADDLQAALPPDRKQIVIAGCEAHVCLLQTALSLLGLGYQVWVVLDASGSRRDSDRDAAWARLQQAGAHGVTVEMVAFEWLHDSRHPLFREALKFIK